MEDQQEIKELFDLISHLNHKQWNMVKTIVDMAYDAKIKDTKVCFDDVITLICDDLIENGL